MSFVPFAPTRKVPGHGPADAKIAIVGDYTSAYDDQAMRPFQGGAGTVLDKCLHAAGLIRGEVYMTNVFKTRSNFRGKAAAAGPAPEWFHEGRSAFTADGSTHVASLREELDAGEANVIVACGPAASAALAALRKPAALRGYVFESVGLKRVRKVIPTHHPGAAIRGNYTYAHIITCDLQKALLESKTPDLVRPKRNLVYNYSSIQELQDWADYLATCKALSIDIEVVNYEIASVQFSPRPDLGVVFPLGETVFQPNGWTEDEEFIVWKQIQRLCETEHVEKILQNGIFDIHFLLTNAGIEVKGPIKDTMIGHSCAWPELPKGLGFLGSLYCGSQAYWKDKVDFNSIKGDD